MHGNHHYSQSVTEKKREDLLVELRGLEPLTPCLQNPHKVSRTVHGLG